LSSLPRLQPKFLSLHASNDSEDRLETILNHQMDGNPPQPPVKLVRSYQRHPPPQIVLVITSFASGSAPESPVTPNSSSASTQPSLRAARASLAAESVEGWDDEDHSDEAFVSGSDFAVSTDPETGRLCDDWYEPADFEELLEQIFGPEEEVDEESEDEEREREETASESEGE
ncbi:hypothetical protein B0H14DRAFT_3599704, partial [Mycena olivaceomarginata]